MSLKHALLDALEKKYDAEIAAADATIKIYLTNPVGIGEHPQHLDEIDKQLAKITENRMLRDNKSPEFLAGANVDANHEDSKRRVPDVTGNKIIGWRATTSLESGLRKLIDDA